LFNRVNELLFNELNAFAAKIIIYLEKI